VAREARRRGRHQRRGVARPRRHPRERPARVREGTPLTTREREPARSHADDLRGASKLAVEATRGVTALVEELHRTIASGPAILGRPLAAPARIATRIVYGSIRGVTRLVGAGLDRALAELGPLLGESAPSAERDALLAALNGVLGDYLEDTQSALAIEMSVRRDGRALPLEDAAALGAAIPNATGKLLLLAHGSSMNDRQWSRAGHDHGAALARDLGFTPVYLRYNSGRHVSTNGAELAQLLERVSAAWPVPIERLAIVAHSMGGLVARSACHAAERAGLAWRARLDAIAFLGTPHHGAPLERGGNWLDLLLGVSRYSAPFTRLAQIRSAGVTDLRFGYVLDEHWQGRDRFALGADERRPLPLPEGVACHAIAGKSEGGLAGALGGDGLVPVESALGRHERAELTLGFPEASQVVIAGVGHVELLGSAAVHEALRGWLK
jgi:hypothetical protein